MTTMSKKQDNIPKPIKIIGWFGIILACTYLLWGVVGGILSILDRTYKDIDKNLIIIFYGILIMVVSLAFKSMQKWGWYGLFLLLVFFVVWTLFSYTDVYGIILGILSLLALVGVLSPPVRKHYF